MKSIKFNTSSNITSSLIVHENRRVTPHNVAHPIHKISPQPHNVGFIRQKFHPFKKDYLKVFKNFFKKVKKSK